jgi:hypothetical protein
MKTDVMLKLLCVGFVMFSGTVLAQPQKSEFNTLKEELIALEKKSWEAWRNRDSRFFEEFLSTDHIEVGTMGVSKKAEIVSFVGSNACSMKNFKVDHFELSILDGNTALLTYHAIQETQCDGKPAPSPVWVSSLYQKRDKRWQNVVYQQSLAVN